MQKKTKGILIAGVVLVIILAAALTVTVRSYHSYFWCYETVTIHHGDMTQTLPEAEGQAVIKMLNHKEYTPGAGGCPFGEELTITVGDTVFFLSQDGCAGLKEVQHQRYYVLSNENWETLHTIFSKYSAGLPGM